MLLLDLLVINIHYNNHEQKLSTTPYSYRVHSTAVRPWSRKHHWHTTSIKPALRCHRSAPQPFELVIIHSTASAINCHNRWCPKSLISVRYYIAITCHHTSTERRAQNFHNELCASPSQLTITHSSASFISFANLIESQRAFFLRGSSFHPVHMDGLRISFSWIDAGANQPLMFLIVMISHMIIFFAILSYEYPGWLNVDDIVVGRCQGLVATRHGPIPIVPCHYPNQYTFSQYCSYFDLFTMGNIAERTLRDSDQPVTIYHSAFRPWLFLPRHQKQLYYWHHAIETNVQTGIPHNRFS